MAEFSYQDTEALLRRLADASERVVVVGGQALNFWAERYRSRVPELAEGGPFTSKDIDFLGGPDAVKECAIRLDGTCRLADGFDDATVHTGVVEYHDHHGRKVELDFLRDLYGVDGARVRRTSIPIDILDDDERPTGVRFHVMQPVVCMESRGCNVVGLPGYDTPHARRQLRASVQCAREFLRDLLDEERTRDVLTLSEQIYTFCADDPLGRRVYASTGIDPFDAVVCDDSLPELFVGTRYPQMCESLKRQRAKVPRP